MKTKTTELHPAMREFQTMRLTAYQNVSLKRPLTDSEFNEMKKLAKELYGCEMKG